MSTSTEIIAAIRAARLDMLGQFDAGRPVASALGLQAELSTAAAIAGSVAAGYTAGATIGATIGAIGGPIGSVIGGALGLLLGALALPPGQGQVELGRPKCELEDGSIVELEMGDWCDCIRPRLISATLDSRGDRASITTAPWRARAWVDSTEAQRAALYAAWQVGAWRDIQGGYRQWQFGQRIDRGRSDYPQGADQNAIREWAYRTVLPEFYEQRSYRQRLSSCISVLAKRPESRALAERLFDGRFGVAVGGSKSWWWNDERISGHRLRDWPAWLPVGDSRAHLALLLSARAGATAADLERISHLDPMVSIGWPGRSLESLSTTEADQYYAQALVIGLAASGSIDDLAALAMRAAETHGQFSDSEILEAWQRLLDDPRHLAPPPRPPRARKFAIAGACLLAALLIRRRFN